jgi:hypothetical protein
LCTIVKLRSTCPTVNGLIIVAVRATRFVSRVRFRVRYAYNFRSVERVRLRAIFAPTHRYRCRLVEATTSLPVGPTRTIHAEDPGRSFGFICPELYFHDYHCYQNYSYHYYDVLLGRY